MGVLESVKHAIGGDDVSVRLHECRDCGVSLGEKVNTCPVCGSAEIAYYEW